MSLESSINGLIKLLEPDLKAVHQLNQGNKDKSPKPYAGWRIISEVTVGLPELFSTDSATYITETVNQQRKVQLEVNFYSNSREFGSLVARDYCNSFLAKLYLNSSLMYQESYGLSVLDTQNYSNLDTHLGDKWERRALCELTLLYSEQVSDNIPFIESVKSIKGTFVTTP